MPLYIKKIPDGSITTSKIADGAVTDAKISGRLSLSKLPTSSTANSVLAVRTANADPVYDQIRTNDIADNAVTDAKISAVSIGKVTVDADKDFNAKSLTNVNWMQSSRLIVSPANRYEAIKSRIQDHYITLYVGAVNSLAYFDTIFAPDFGFGSRLLFADQYGTLTTQNVSNAPNVFRVGDSYATVNTSAGDAIIELTNISIEGDTNIGRNAVFIQPHSYGFSVTIKIEVRDKEGNWVTIYNGNVSFDFSRHIFISPKITNYIPDTNWPITGLRITFSNSTVNPFSIRKIGILSAVTAQKMPWVSAGGDIIYGNLNPGKDNTYDIGSDTLRWRRIRAVTVSTGDIELANDWKITELENGVVIKNQNGEEIFKITEDGLWFKGNKIA